MTRNTNGKNKGNTPELTFLENPLTKDQLIERGESASRLLANPAFNLAFRSIIQSWQDQILESQEHETRKREGLYLKMHALGEAAGELEAYWRLAESLSAEQLSEEEQAALAIQQRAQSGYIN